MSRARDEVWYFKPANDDGLRIPLKIRQHDVEDVQITYEEESVFSEFAEKHFSSGMDHCHTTKPLNRPLLRLIDEVDKHISIVLWSTILRFMGDMPEPRHLFLDANALEKSTFEQRDSVLSPDNWMSTSDKLRFIVGLGINRPHLRDEIYCQLCKQVTDNPSKGSLVKGWILIALCLGCFIPSSEMQKVLTSIMKVGPDNYATYCDQKIRRTARKGSRKHPASTLELQAAQRVLFPKVPVEIDDGQEIMFDIDSSTTAHELCVDVAEEIGLRDGITDYAIQISIFGKTINLGNYDEKVMDSIWLCEQSARQRGNAEECTTWRMYHRKIIFTPLDEFNISDVNWTDFAYRYVVDDFKPSVVSRLRRRISHASENDLRNNGRRNSVDGLDQKSVDRNRYPSVSSAGSSFEFGAPHHTDSGSESSNIVYWQENNNPTKNQIPKLQRICSSDNSTGVYNLKIYAQKNFTSSEHIKNWKQHGALSSMWSHQTEAIKLPVLLSIVGNQELSNIAVNMFANVLAYMEKCSTPRASKYYKIELVRKIFSAALKQDELKDELYCQILKQLTNNDNKGSMQHGWHLMFLCTSMFPCSDDLLKEVMLFLVSWSKYETAAVKCLTLLRKTVLTGKRFYPPHFVEYVAATKWCESILHRVAFPDRTAKNFNVDSHTKVQDITNDIIERLKLIDQDGYSLFIQVFSKIIVLNPDDYIFDAIQHWTEKIDYIMPEHYAFNKAKGVPYKLLFLKRLWNTVCPGRDPIADAVFLYPQEFLKYMRGYYQLTVEDVSYLAALIMRLKFGEKLDDCPEVTDIFNELMPSHLVNALFPEIWRQAIIVNYEEISPKSPAEIRKEFLLTLQKLDRFGSAYFKVRRRTTQDVPDSIYLGINCRAIHLIHILSKTTLKRFPVENIVSHFGEDGSYTVQVQTNINEIETFVFGTNQDYEIANMVGSYVPK